MSPSANPAVSRPRRVRAAAVGLLVGSALLLAACGGSSDPGESKAGTKCPSPAAALTGATGLPAGFPTPSGVVYTATKTAGPSQIVTGSMESSLSSAFSSWKTALGTAPYRVTKSEKDAHDAEVVFAGTGTTGQVKLGEACDGRTSLVVTVRPG